LDVRRRSRSMLRTFLISAVVFGFAVHTGVAERREMSGREAEALAVALRVFKSKQGSKDQWGHPVYGDLKHYTVELERTRNRLEVRFVPDQPASKSNEAATGGSTVYGWVVVYVFSLAQFKMIEEHYAR
jgi:hypothetical protein